MKKDQPRQRRRQRAHARFTIRPRHEGEDPKAYAAYLARKDQESASLAKSLSI